MQGGVGRLLRVSDQAAHILEREGTSRRQSLRYMSRPWRADDSVAGSGTNKARNQRKIGHNFFACSTAPPWTWAWTATWWGLEMPWCLGQPGACCCKKDQNMPQGPHACFGLAHVGDGKRG